MAESHDPDVRQSTTHRELITYVIEDPPSLRQRASCDWTPVLTLRETGRSLTERSAVVRANDRRKV